MEIYYDGLSVASYPWVKGVTTNCTLMSGRCYAEFYESIRGSLDGRPISFQIWEDDEELARQQIDAIHAIDARIFVKIPIHNSLGEPNDALFRQCSERGIPVNVTSLYTYEQIDRASKCLEGSTAPLIISIFAGPISDIGIDPVPYIRHAKHVFGSRAKILWAGCREAYTVQRATEAGADIITVPDGVIERLHPTKTLEELSIERVRKFRSDAQKGHTKIKL